MRLNEVIATDYGLHPERFTDQTCLVVGGGRNVWQEFREAKDQCPTARVMAVNAVGCYVPGILHYWFSLHCYFIKVAEEMRRLNHKSKTERYKRPVLFSTHHTSSDGVHQGDIDAIWKFTGDVISKSAKQGGSLEDSGFMAMLLALMLGYGQVVLVGCPADESGHVFIPEWTYLQHDKAAIRLAWIKAIEAFPEIPARVRSCSGLTRDVLGAPTWG